MKEVIGLIQAVSERNKGLKIQNSWYNLTDEQLKLVSNLDKSFPIRIVVDDERNILDIESLKDQIPNGGEDVETNSFAKSSKEDFYQEKLALEREKAKLEERKQENITNQVIFKGAVDIVCKLIERNMILETVDRYADMVITIYNKLKDNLDI